MECDDKNQMLSAVMTRSPNLRHANLMLKLMQVCGEMDEAILREIVALAELRQARFSKQEKAEAKPKLLLVSSRI